MGIFEILDLIESKDGNELFEKVKNLLGRLGIDIYNEDGSVKDVHTVCHELAAARKRSRDVD